VKAQIVLLTALGVMATHPVVGQSSLTGFWVLSSRQCLPQRAGCKVASPVPFDSQMAIDVQPHALVITAAGRTSSNPFAPVRSDTIRVDGIMTRWLPARRGVSRDWSPTSSADQRQQLPGTLIPGESWTLAPNGRTLVHEFHWNARDSTLQTVWTYVRSAG
jgi:hypothetical protein